MCLYDCAMNAGGAAVVAKRVSRLTGCTLDSARPGPAPRANGRNEQAMPAAAPW